MNNILIENNSEQIKELLNATKILQNSLSAIKALNRNRPFNGEFYITDRDLSERLRISRRTLQMYRDQGKLPYYQIGGKILYKESDVQRVLEGYYRKGFDLPY